MKQLQIIFLNRIVLCLLSVILFENKYIFYILYMDLCTTHSAAAL